MEAYRHLYRKQAAGFLDSITSRFQELEICSEDLTVESLHEVSHIFHFG
jgi:hypothetical protein